MMDNLGKFKGDPLGDGISDITLLDMMGNDLTIINAAKASYGRESSEMGDKERRLMETLLKGITEPQHTAPLRHVVYQFKVKAPLAVCRQWWKHVIGSTHIDENLGWNETSFRYTEVDVENFYIPNKFCTQNSINKQSSGPPLDNDKHIRMLYESHCLDSGYLYKHLIVSGVSREQARLVLPPAYYTSFHWTISLQALLHFVDLREGHGAQWEIGQYANFLHDVVSKTCPVALEAWTRRKETLVNAMDCLSS